MIEFENSYSFKVKKNLSNKKGVCHKGIKARSFLFFFIKIFLCVFATSLDYISRIFVFIKFSKK